MEELLGRMPPCPKIVRGQQRLTPQQEEYARHFAQERIARMLAPTPIDEQKAEAHLREAYRVAGLRPPVTIRWFDSPIPFVVTCAQDMSVWEANVYDSMRDLRLCQDVSRYESVGEGVWRGVSERVMFKVRESVVENVWYIVMDNAKDTVGDTVWVSVNPTHWGCIWTHRRAHMCAEDRFFHEIFEEDPLIHQALFNEMVFGYLPGSKEAWVVRKPILLELDEQDRLHSASGRCVEFRDGWGFYAWHGVQVSEKIILHPEQITREDWLGERNLEVRRVIQERLGNDRFVELVGGMCIDRGTRGNLIEVDLGEEDPEGVAHYVQVQDASTERHYSLRVPPSIRRADDVVAWTFDLDEPDYQPVQET